MSGLPNSCPRVADASVATREPRNRIPSARPQAGHCPSRPACASGVTRTANWLPCRLVGGGTTSAVSGSTQTTSVEPCAASPGANIHARDTDRSIADLLHIEVGAVPVLPPAVATTPQPDRPQCRQNTEGRNLVPSSTVTPEHGGAGQPSQEPAHFSDPQLHVDSEQRGAICSGPGEQGEVQRHGVTPGGSAQFVRCGPARFSLLRQVAQRTRRLGQPKQGVGERVSAQPLAERLVVEVRGAKKEAFTGLELFFMRCAPLAG